MKKRKTEASVLPGAEAQGTVAAHVCSPTPVSPAHMPGRGGRGFLCCTNAARVGKRDMCRQETWPAYPGATSLGLGPPSARIWFLRLSRGLGPGASRRCGLRRSSQESRRERGSPGCLRPRELAVRARAFPRLGAGRRLARKVRLDLPGRSPRGGAGPGVSRPRKGVSFLAGRSEVSHWCVVISDLGFHPCGQRWGQKTPPPGMGGVEPWP